jgi:hypothetical protein
VKPKRFRFNFRLKKRAHSTQAAGRLIANLPPLISLARRADYVDLLWNHETAVGAIKADATSLPPHIRQLRHLRPSHAKNGTNRSG